jgi:hypothetical protein
LHIIGKTQLTRDPRVGCRTGFTQGFEHGQAQVFELKGRVRGLRPADVAEQVEERTFQVQFAGAHGDEAELHAVDLPAPYAGCRAKTSYSWRYRNGSMKQSRCAPPASRPGNPRGLFLIHAAYSHFNRP